MKEYMKKIFSAEIKKAGSRELEPGKV